jgi:hypothetical protein
MGGLTMATNIMNDDRDTFHLFVHDKLDNIWVCMDNAFSGPAHYYYYYYYYYYYCYLLLYTLFRIY